MRPCVFRVNHCRDWAFGTAAQVTLAAGAGLAILRQYRRCRRVKAMKHSTDLLVVARPVIALDDEYPAGFVDPMHSHLRTQILFASAGVMSVRTDETSFVVPPQRAVWIPAGVTHEVSCRDSVSLRTLYLDAELGREPHRCRVFEVSFFLKALILEVVGFDPLYDVDGREGRVVALLLEEIDRMPNAPYRVSMPTDQRLLRVCRAILAGPPPTAAIWMTGRSSSAWDGGLSRAASRTRRAWAWRSGGSRRVSCTHFPCCRPASPSRRSRSKWATTAPAPSLPCSIAPSVCAAESIHRALSARPRSQRFF